MHDLPDPNQLGYALAFVRVSVLLFALPLFGDAPMPLRARILAAFALTAGLTPLIASGIPPGLVGSPLMVVGSVLREVLLGLVVGYTARVAFAGILLASSCVSYQMGFGSERIFMVDLGTETDKFTGFHHTITMLLFLVLGLHGVFIEAIVDTFRLVPLGEARFAGGLGELFIVLTAGIFTTAISLAAPLVVAMLFTSAALGLVARTVPQFQVFALSFPISFYLGLATYIATLPLIPGWMHEHFTTAHDSLTAAVRLMSR